MRKVEPYNPLDKKNLVESAASALLRREPEVLPHESVEGAGIYPIYYLNDFEAYQPLADKNRIELDAPIDVGKADPKGGHRAVDLDAPTGPALPDRYCKHARSSKQANNLEITNFRCRHLVFDDVWVRMAKRMLVSWYRLLWNIAVDGFGKNSNGRYNLRRCSGKNRQVFFLGPHRPLGGK